MLYTVRFQFAVVVEADNASDAYAKAKKKIKDDPGMAISAVIPGGNTPKVRPLWVRLLTGK